MDQQSIAIQIAYLLCFATAIIVGKFAWQQYKKWKEEMVKPLFIPYKILKPLPSCVLTKKVKRVCAVLGGTGFIGSYVVHELIRREEYHVIAVGRTFREKRTNPDADGLIQVDMLDVDGLTKAFQGVDSVINTAMIFPDIYCTPSELYSKNCLGVANVIKAAKNAAVKNLIYVSGIPTANEYEDPVCVAYAKSLDANEKAVLDANGEDGLQSCVIGPPAVVGFRSNVYDELMKSRKFLDIDNMPFSFLPVEYFSSVLVNAEKKLSDPDTANEITGKAFRVRGEPMSWKKFLTLPGWSKIKFRLWPCSVMNFLIRVNIICYKLLSWPPFGPGLVPALIEISESVEAVSEEEAQMAYRVLGMGPPRPSMNEYVKQLVEKYNAVE